MLAKRIEEIKEVLKEHNLECTTENDVIKVGDYIIIKGRSFFDYEYRCSDIDGKYLIRHDDRCSDVDTLPLKCIKRSIANFAEFYKKYIIPTTKGNHDN